MKVVFARYDERRYGIGVIRDGRHDVGADCPVRGGPGMAALPHDLVHFVVEEQAGLNLGVFGQVAAGGECNGFFRPAPADRRATDQRRSQRVARAGREQAVRSEQLAALVDHEGRLRPGAAGIIGDERLHRRIEIRLGQVLTQWRAVPVGGELVLEWPDRLTIRNGRVPSGRVGRAAASGLSGGAPRKVRTPQGRVVGNAHPG